MGGGDLANFFGNGEGPLLSPYSVALLLGSGLTTAGIPTRAGAAIVDRQSSRPHFHFKGPHCRRALPLGTDEAGINLAAGCF